MVGRLSHESKSVATPSIWKQQQQQNLFDCCPMSSEPSRREAFRRSLLAPWWVPQCQNSWTRWKSFCERHNKNASMTSIITSNDYSSLTSSKTTCSVLVVIPLTPFSTGSCYINNINDDKDINPRLTCPKRPISWDVNLVLSLPWKHCVLMRI